MLKIGIKIVIQAILITAATAVLAITTNLIRPDGIPLIAEVEYDIFAQCVDSEAESAAASSGDLKSGKVLYIDARPEATFQAEHVKGAKNVPYSVLFGASVEDIEKIQNLVLENDAKTVVVYGLLEDPESPGEMVDLATSLAEQLIENEVAGVKHIEGGIEELKKSGVSTVKGDGESK